ncbi:hypothetical protein GGS23DRAFT_471149 [Durotheca rogersii]|uniref:uncharacterized protein n=1 Tax=Durotheca rogersii TaxID=419775 RepID=UPI00221F904D|nr:uncharacterized protein GGS23DRAFT_471149 [Durotheca rogersii]KAI5855000.1 hypothetical protein GGS23DRAFT_471149 [Durotheca rogersii]
MGLEDDAPPPYSRYPEPEPAGRLSVAPDLPPALPPRPQQAPRRTSFPSPPAAAAAGPQKFPAFWTLRRRGGARDEYYIAADGDPSRAVFAVTSHAPDAAGRQPHLTLHDGPGRDAPPLARGGPHKTLAGGVHSVLLLPGAGSGVAPEEPLRTVISWPHISYAFDADVGTADPSRSGWLRRETFEWRHSAGSAVASLDAAPVGWKLIRTSPDPPPGIRSDDWAFLSGGEFSSDGKEIVAVWADVRGLRPGPSELMKFRFLGSGASGVLGERWATMAAISAMRMWQQGEMARR